jgi:hypothetical protein
MLDEGSVEEDELPDFDDEPGRLGDWDDDDEDDDLDD